MVLVDMYYSSRHVLFEKGSTASASATNTFRAQVQTSGKVFLLYADYDPGYIYHFWETTSSLSSGKNFITIYDDRSSKTRTVDIYVNGSSLGGGSWTEVGTFDSSTFNFTNSFNMHMGRTSKSGGGFDYKGTGAHFCGFAYDEELSLADHQYMYNNETPLCWDDMVTNNSTLTNKFDAYFDNATYNSRTELQARTDHVNGWILDNNGSSEVIVIDGTSASGVDVSLDAGNYQIAYETGAVNEVALPSNSWKTKVTILQTAETFFDNGGAGSEAAAIAAATGQTGTFTVATATTYKFYFNDSVYGDNQGSMTCSITKFAPFDNTYLSVECEV